MPPADPEYGWECLFCDYCHRCSQSDEPYSDEGPREFLPGFADYPRDRVVEYLGAHDDAKLTPTLGQTFPDLAVEYSIQQWMFPQCRTKFDWDAVDWDGRESDLPVFPECATADNLAVLKVSPEGSG